jgi:hypothetical protein
VTAPSGHTAIRAVSDLDLDTDGVRDTALQYEPTHLRQTSLDPGGKWLDSNALPYFVLPGGFVRFFAGAPLGVVATVFYGGRHCHAVYADTGPRGKFGEGSIALHRALGFERVRPDGSIRDQRIEGGVTTLIYQDCLVPQARRRLAFRPADINAVAEPLLELFIEN